MIIKMKLVKKAIIYSNNYRYIIEINKNFDFSLNTYGYVSKIIKGEIFIFNKTKDKSKYKLNNKTIDISN